MHNKNIIIVIAAILVASFTLFINLNNNNKEPQELYRVYLAGKSIGLINSKEELENYIDNEQQQLKDVYKVDKVYQPKNLEVIKEVTYDNNIVSTGSIYNQIKNDSPFTISGYKIVISGVKEKDEGGKETTTPTQTIYTLTKETFTEAVEKTITAFVDKEVYEQFLKGETPKIKDIGKTTEDVFIENSISIKKENVPVDEPIFLNVDDLTKYLLFGTLENQKEYIVQDGDTINDVAFANKISAQEFLVANPEFKSANNLLFPGQKVTLGILKPKFKTIEEVYEVKLEEVKYKLEIQYDNNLLLGTEYVKQKGENGLEKISTKTKYINGESVLGQIVSSEIIKPTIPEIIIKGGRSGILGEVGYWAWPTKTPYIITSPFGWRWGQLHDGVDISGTGYGSPIYVANHGTVVKVGYGHWPNGNYIIVNHNNGFYTIYAHLSSIYVREGQVVSLGDVIAGMGNTGLATGTHLHFGVFRGYPYGGGVAYNPLELYS